MEWGEVVEYPQVNAGCEHTASDSIPVNSFPFVRSKEGRSDLCNTARA